MLPASRGAAAKRRRRRTYSTQALVNACVALLVITACTLLALAMSHTMVLQHHYGHHLFGDDLAQGAKVYTRVHRRHGHEPFKRLRDRVTHLATDVEVELANFEERVAQPVPQVTSGSIRRSGRAVDAAIRARLSNPNASGSDSLTAADGSLERTRGDGDASELRLDDTDAGMFGVETPADRLHAAKARGSTRLSERDDTSATESREVLHSADSNGEGRGGADAVMHSLQPTGASAMGSASFGELTTTSAATMSAVGTIGSSFEGHTQKGSDSEHAGGINSAPPSSSVEQGVTSGQAVRTANSLLAPIPGLPEPTSATGEALQHSLAGPIPQHA